MYGGCAGTCAQVELLKGVQGTGAAMPCGPSVPPLVVPHRGTSVILQEKSSELGPAPQETIAAIGSRHLVQSPFRVKLWLDVSTDVLSCVLATLTFYLAPRFVL